MLWNGAAQSSRTKIDRQQACKHLLHVVPWRWRDGRERQTSHQSQRCRARSQGRSRVAGRASNALARKAPTGCSLWQAVRKNDSAANRASRQARNGLTQDHAGGRGTADAGLHKGTHMRRQTILHALSTPAAVPHMSPRARERAFRTLERD